MNILKRIGQIFLGFIATYFLADSIIRLVDEIKARQLMKEIDNIREETKAEKVDEEKKEETTTKKSKSSTATDGTTLRFTVTNSDYVDVHDYREDIEDIKATQSKILKYVIELDRHWRCQNDIV